MTSPLSRLSGEDLTFWWCRLADAADHHGDAARPRPRARRAAPAAGLRAGGRGGAAALRSACVDAPLDLTLPHWEPDPTFDLDYHLRRHALPRRARPGRALPRDRPRLRDAVRPLAAAVGGARLRGLARRPGGALLQAPPRRRRRRRRQRHLRRDDRLGARRRRAGRGRAARDRGRRRVGGRAAVRRSGVDGGDARPRRARRRARRRRRQRRWPTPIAPSRVARTAPRGAALARPRRRASTATRR